MIKHKQWDSKKFYTMTIGYLRIHFSYDVVVAVGNNNLLIVNEKYTNYSRTTSSHINLIYDKDDPNHTVISDELFGRLLRDLFPNYFMRILEDMVE